MKDKEDLNHNLDITWR